ncbi:protein of unknown function DUF1130 [Solidesulfovibrio fructosivorans JJ]]|uniref:DUF488 domain-containing protein n=1 Tax=Solidesulfovibrio fructosivorans JJ] TaxID=596151 RepID=E1JR84_SOLFR|nr:DUF488 family protein [Solidesulfovibrio fructosivorans]EFL53085.1 protein of unknown function DUF1130 [Solidesulfovibrio fructosivorans JJ]]
MITVSYFASKAPSDRKICIAKGRPRYFKGLSFRDFAPLNPHDLNDWQNRYRRELEARYPDALSLQAALGRIEDRVPNPILCCYEKDPAECHRTILAQFIQERLGLEVPEWAPGM